MAVTLDTAAANFPATSLAPAVRTTTANGTAIDLAGYMKNTIILTSGTITDGTHTPTVEESDASGSGFATVDASSLSTALVAVTGSAVQKTSYIGTKRYIRVVTTITGSPSTGGAYDAIVIRSAPRTI